MNIIGSKKNTSAENDSRTIPAFYRFASKAGTWVFLVFSGLLLLTGLFCNAYIDDMISQVVLFKWGFSFAVIPGIIIILGINFLIRFLTKTGGTFRKALLFVTILWIFAAGVFVAFFGRTVPAADAMAVYSMAESAASGEFLFVSGAESYLSYYPQQIGMITAYILPIKIWNLLSTGIPAYHMIKILNIFLACATVLFQYYTLKKLLFGKEKENTVCCIYLILTGLSLPFILYTSFLYGEIPSIAAISASMFFLICIIHDENNIGKTKLIIFSALFVLFTALSVFLRKNSLIYVIALSIVLVIEWIKRKKLLYPLLLIAAVVCSLGILPAVLKIYETAVGRTVLPGVTALSYFAMGMQEAERGCGWYNGFNFLTYESSGLDTDLANEISRNAIIERLNFFRENPAYAAKFYLQKYASQWADGTYASRQATWAELGGRSSFMQSLYTGSLGKAFTIFCDVHQSLIYIGAFLYYLKNIIASKKSADATSFFLHLGFIYVFGGFLFHMLWEANSRYIFPYSIFLIPYAAAGLSHFVSLIKYRPKSR